MKSLQQKHSIPEKWSSEKWGRQKWGKVSLVRSSVLLLALALVISTFVKWRSFPPSFDQQLAIDIRNSGGAAGNPKVWAELAQPDRRRGRFLTLFFHYVE